MQVDIALVDGYIVAFIKLNHAIAGIYMCVRLNMQEAVRVEGDFNSHRTSVGKRYSQPASNWISYEENGHTDGQYG
jgi:hypothetical protein